MTTTTDLVVVTCRTSCRHRAFAFDRFDGERVYSVGTDCCNAAVTGSGNDVVCKACWKAVPDWLGMETIEQQLELAGCPCPDECAVHTRWLLDQALDATSL
mgnify:CR=1 FL=1